ncbi:MAG: prepilin-type N-terminal cleavage/methylation domain-containing protein [Clostridiales bacterium]|nr:prepilin-type N-terminal cleavage/methylation domain-containing protein [Clostridiales bacterium]
MNKNNFKSREYGFTLIELLIAMAITGIVSAAIFTAFQSQQNSYLIQDDVTVMQQNLRAGMDMMVREIRMAGYDPDGAMIGAAITSATANSVTFKVGTVDTYIYSYDNANNTLDRDLNGSGGQPVAENIEALGFAYAYDADSDGNLDTYTAGGKEVVIWAIDSDGNNDLDTNLDTDIDGEIDEHDGPKPSGTPVDIDGDGDLDAFFNLGLKRLAGTNGQIGGNPIATPVGLDAICAVRIWLLAKADRRDNHFANTRTYVVGNQVITPDPAPEPNLDTNNDSIRMRLLTTTVTCRNLGL